MKKLLAPLALAALLTAPTFGQQEERVLWISIADGITAANANTARNNINAAMDFAQNNGFNAVSILARYRANTFYIPNRQFNDFPSSEPTFRSDNFDVLQHTIDGARARNLRVYASFSVFLVTDGDSQPYPSFLPSDWRMWYYESTTPSGTFDPTGNRPMLPTDPSASGIWIDPGIPAVREYTINMMLDLLRNYDVDGLILDRVRFPGDRSPANTGTYGFTPLALQNYAATIPGFPAASNPPAPNSTIFRDARRLAVTNFVSEAHAAAAELRPWIAVGATPVIFGNNTTSTYNSVFQFIPQWSARPNPNKISGLGALDFVMPQYYRDGNNTSVPFFSNILAMASQRPDVQNMSHQPLFRSFDLTPTLAAHNAESICNARTNGDDGWGFFAYNGLLGMIADINATSTTCGTNLISGPTPPNIDYSDKVGFNTIIPGAISDLTASPTISPGSIILRWSEAPNAVRYRIYRSTDPTVPRVFANLITTVDGVQKNAFLDKTAGLANGPIYYSVEAISDWNNRSQSNIAMASVANIIELTKSRASATLGPNPGPEYVELTAGWSDSNVSSSAPGNPNFGSRFTTTANASAQFRPAINQAGFYEVDFTTNNAVTHNAVAAISINGLFRTLNSSQTITGGAFGNIWTQLNSEPIFFEAGASNANQSVTFTRTAGPDRLNLDALRFRLVEAFPLIRLAPKTSNSVTLSFPTREANRTVAISFPNGVSHGGLIQFEEFRSNASAATDGGNPTRLINQAFEIIPDSDLDFSNNTGGATIVFNYSPSLLNGLTSADLNAVFAVNNSNVTLYEGAAVTFDHAANRVTVTGVDSFSTWFIGAADAFPVTAVNEWQLLAE